MKNLPIVTTATPLHCGQCGTEASRLVVNGADATCSHCGDVTYVAHDIAPHVESTRVLVVTTAGHLSTVDLGTFDTESPEPIAIECSECCAGNYYLAGFAARGYECDECGHTIAVSDVELEAGETLTRTADGALAYTPADY